MSLREDLVRKRDELQIQSDSLQTTIAEATAEKAAIDAQVTLYDKQIEYVDAGSPSLPGLDAVANFQGYTDLSNPSNIKNILSWDAVAGTDVKYVLVYSLNPDFSGSVGLQDATPLLTYTHENLQNGITYYYRIYAMDAGATNSPTSDLTLTVQEQLGDIENLTITGQDSAVSISFDAVDFAQSYHVLRSTTSDIDTAVEIVEIFDPAYLDSDVVNGTTYYYWIYASALNFTNSDTVTDSATPNP